MVSCAYAVALLMLIEIRMMSLDAGLSVEDESCCDFGQE